MFILTKQELSTVMMIWGQQQGKNNIFTLLVSKSEQLWKINTSIFTQTDSVLEPLVPKIDTVEDYIDIKASNILMESDKYR